MSRPPQRTTIIYSIGLLLLISSVLCAFEIQAKAPVRTPHLPYAYVHGDCGPADGPALNFYFTLKESECGKETEPFIHISVISNLPKFAPTEYSIGGGGAEAFASRCLKHGECEPVTSGTLHLDKFINGKLASGNYELHFRDGSVEKASSNAVWCYVRQLLCG